MEWGDLMWCRRCSVVVMSIDKHDDWHKAQDDRLAELEKAVEVAKLGAEHALLGFES